MTGHIPWKLQNGNRLGQHRKEKIPGLQWTILATIIAALFFICKMAEGQEYEPYNEGTGLIVQQAELCFAPEINSDTIKLLNTWQQLVNEIEAYERGGSLMNKEDALLGQLLYEHHMCATVADFYHVVVVRRAEGYALLDFDEQYGFDSGPFIVAARDILPDRVL